MRADMLFGTYMYIIRNEENINYIIILQGETTAPHGPLPHTSKDTDSLNEKKKGNVTRMKTAHESMVYGPHQLVKQIRLLMS